MVKIIWTIIYVNLIGTIFPHVSVRFFKVNWILHRYYSMDTWNSTASRQLRRTSHIRRVMWTSRFRWVVLRIVVWRKDRFRWPVNRRRDSIAPKKSVYGAKLTRRGGVSWPGDKAARCPWRSRHRVLPIILYPRLVPVAYIFYFLSAPLILASNVRIVKITQTFLSSS